MTDELACLEREIAEECARWRFVRATARCHQDAQDEKAWHEMTGYFAESVRYLELRGLLERHPERPELVRFVEKADEQ